MGYRHYMYIVPRKMVSDICEMSYAELKEYAKQHGVLKEDCEGSWVYLNDLIGRNTFFEFGKYYENAENIYKLGKPLFIITDTQEYFEEYNPFVVDKDAVLCAIEDYRQKVIKFYKELLQTQEEYDATHDTWERRRGTQEQKIRRHLESQLDEWENPFGLLPYDLSEKSNRVVKSWLYEYETFEIVHQLKMMDWENYTLVFYGW